jgi:hypothetical protein
MRIEMLERERDARIWQLETEIVKLKRRPYDEELGRQAATVIARLSQQGVALLRHLVVNEPLEVGRQFMREIAADIQSAQLAIAYGAGIIRHNPIYVGGGGHLLRTDFVVTAQFRPVLQDLLFNK